ncbi:MAG: hypothetical protein Q9M91_02390 [Candidatus Dojkabacteria bacterium]|nr:hypothetical protein [Candidatus Dojkabacteria bacterium]MDQ7020674.1 hypothetical protein [Candidatus Dojkabacteria bacterium]
MENFIFEYEDDKVIKIPRNYWINWVCINHSLKRDLSIAEKYFLNIYLNIQKSLNPKM